VAPIGGSGSPASWECITLNARAGKTGLVVALMPIAEFHGEITQLEVTKRHDNW
jgi:hypothetical protein